MAEDSKDDPLIGKLDVQAGAKAVIAGSVHNLHLHPEPKYPLTPLDLFATVPPLPPNFIDRPEISEPLRSKLLSNSGALALTAIEGMGGVGKTIVALGLCHDPLVRAAFPDGII
jgi:hypothetical protein